MIAGMSRKRERRLGPPHMDIDRVMIKLFIEGDGQCTPARTNLREIWHPQA